MHAYTPPHLRIIIGNFVENATKARKVHLKKSLLTVYCTVMAQVHQCEQRSGHGCHHAVGWYFCCRFQLMEGASVLCASVLEFNLKMG